MSDFGIDVSGYNTINNWSSVRTMDSWAWAKATQSSGYTSPLFASQMAGGQKAGVVMGAYHFPDPRVSVASNVSHFVSIARAAGAFNTGAFLPMLDMENDSADGITWSASGANSFIAAFRDALRAATGVQQLCVYGPESWYASAFLQPSQWADSNVVLCAAQYSGQPGVLGWSHPRLAVHQYTDAAPTPGAAGNTDRSVILPPFSLQQLTIGGAVSPFTPSFEEDDAMAWYPARNASGWILMISDTGRLEDTGVQVGASQTWNGLPIPNVTADREAQLRAMNNRWDAIQNAALNPPPVTIDTVNANLAIPNAWKATELGAGVTEIKAETA